MGIVHVQRLGKVSHEIVDGVNVTTVNSIRVKSCRRRLTLFLCHSRWRLPGDYAASEMLRRDTALSVNSASIRYDNVFTSHSKAYCIASYFRMFVKNIIEFQSITYSRIPFDRFFFFRLLELSRNYVLQFIDLINAGYPREETNPCQVYWRVKFSTITEIAMSINLNYSRVYIDYYNVDVIAMQLNLHDAQ